MDLEQVLHRLLEFDKFYYVSSVLHSYYKDQHSMSYFIYLLRNYAKGWNERLAIDPKLTNHSTDQVDSHALLTENVE